MKHKLFPLLSLIIIAALVLSACQPAPAPEEPAAEEVEIEEPAVEEAEEAEAEETEEEVTEEEGPCLIIGALHGGPINDAGYNQAMHESIMKIKENSDCVQIIEAENVPEEAGATTTMENMIAEGAGMIIATASSFDRCDGISWSN